MTEEIETDQQKINRVAGEIQVLLEKNRMVLVPMLQLQIVPQQSPIITPPGITDIIQPLG